MEKKVQKKTQNGQEFNNSLNNSKNKLLNSSSQKSLKDVNISSVNKAPKNKIPDKSRIESNIKSSQGNYYKNSSLGDKETTFSNMYG